MAPHDAIIDGFNALPETRTLGEQLIRQARLKTGPGSGRELRLGAVGIAAVCMRLATERLNNGDISYDVAQGVSCIGKLDFKKAYEKVKHAIEEAEKEELPYSELHKKYDSKPFQDLMKPFFSAVEKELLQHEKTLDRTMAIFTGTVYYWVCASAKLTLPETDAFAVENQLPRKTFVALLQLLNDTCLPLKKKIQSQLKGKVLSPTKKSATSTPRQSPRKPNATDDQEQSPLRRQSLRNNPELPPVSPVKRVTQLSPTKIAQPSPFRGLLSRKAPLRELPSKDSPKKRSIQNEQAQDENDGMDVNSTAITESLLKKRKVESPVKPSSLATSSNTRKLTMEPELSVSPTKNKALASSSSFPRSSSRRQVAVESGSSSDESEPEMNLSMRRFRPVYLDFKQWNARDPRLDRIWKKANKQRKALIDSGPLDDSDRMDVDS